MHNLTPADLNHVEEDLGVRTVIDFRSTSERAAEPVLWPAAKAPTVLVEDYKLDNAAIMKAFANPNYTADDLRAAMTTMYQEFPFQFAGQYRRLFEKLVAGDAPLAFNCSAGKDRTGVAAALLLTVLGASRETVVSDYLLSNEYYRPAAPRPGASANSPMAALAAMPADRMKPLQRVERQYIEAAFGAIDKRPGGMDAFISEQLGLTKHDVAALRKRYLQ
jgi:protein-tyrosine phosphatase